MLIIQVLSKKAHSAKKFNLILLKYWIHNFLTKFTIKHLTSWNTCDEQIQISFQIILNT